MMGRVEVVRRFTARHIVNHWIMLVCFAGLVLTGLPQKYPSQAWAKGIVMIIGGVPRVRLLHHLLGTVMAGQLVWHGIETLWRHFVKRRPMTMMPRLDDVKHFLQQVRFNLGLVGEPPRMGRYTFAEKLEYLALVWGTVLMVATGVILLYPVRWGTLVPGEAILAAKAAHGGEALLAFLSILTWHAYFVHIRHWNKSMFTGYLEEEPYAEEHPAELEWLRRGEAPVVSATPRWRVAAFTVATLVILAAVAVFVLWLRSMPATVTRAAPW